MTPQTAGTDPIEKFLVFPQSGTAASGPGSGTDILGRPLSGSSTRPGTPTPTNTAPAPTPGAPASSPGAAYNNFLPPILANPYLSGINAAAQVGTAAGMALPGAAGFHAAMYGPGPTPMEQAFLQSGAALGMRGLNEAFNRVDSQFENAPMHSALAPSMMNAGNQFAEQMMNTAGQMGVQRQGQAANLLPFTFGFPLQAAQFAQESAGGLLGMATQGMYGDMQMPMSLYSGYPMISPAVVQSGGGGGGGKGK